MSWCTKVFDYLLPFIDNMHLGGHSLLPANSLYLIVVLCHSFNRIQINNLTENKVLVTRI